MLSFSKYLITVACLFLTNQAFANAKNEIPCPTPDEIHNTAVFDEAYVLGGLWNLRGEQRKGLWEVIFVSNLIAKNENEALQKGTVAFEKLLLDTPRRLNSNTCDYTPVGADYKLIAELNMIIISG